MNIIDNDGTEAAFPLAAGRPEEEKKMDHRKCEALLMSLEQGSMTAAAKTLGYTQSGITRMIASLEDEVGFPLLLRAKKGVALTRNGELLLPALRDLCNAHRQADELAADIRGVVTGTLSIGSYYRIAANLLPAILRDFGERYPGITVRLEEGGNREMARWLTEHSVDLCFCAEPNKDVECDWLPLFEDEMVAWLPQDHPLANAKGFPVSRFETEPFIITAPNNDTELDRLLAEEKLKPDIRFSTRNGFTTRSMVAAGLGISFNQRLISRSWNDSVVEIPLDPPHTLTLGLAAPDLKEVSPAGKRFIEFARAAIAG